MSAADVERVDSHGCPIEGCGQEVPYRHLMCYRHWRLVSRELRARLYEVWDRGRGAGSQEHVKAMRLCVQEVESELAKLAQEALGG